MAVSKNAIRKAGHLACLREICDKNASCSNTQGSYSCACNPKYIGNGLTCKGKSLLIDALKNL